MKKLLEVKNLKKHFPIKGGLFQKQVAAVKAVDGLDFYIKPGETLGMVGESGCGKSTTAKGILRTVDIHSGKVEFEGTDLASLDNNTLRSTRKNIQMVFQDPYASLNARRTIGSIVGEPIKIHMPHVDKKTRLEMVKELLEEVGLRKEYINRFPHEFSGGQRQRIGIVRSLSIKPKLIICDEPVSALDVSIQAQILNILNELKNKYNLTYIFISHDLSVVKYICDRVVVMYLGKIVELADKKELYDNPKHPYTQALLSAIPIADPTVKRERILLEGDVPSPINPPNGCRFHTRCPYVKDIYKMEDPSLSDIE